MNYLTFDEYDGDKINYTQYVDKAEAVLDYVTNHFYQNIDFESDHEVRKEAYKKAISAQINYFAEKGGDTSAALELPNSVSIGRTSISYRSSYYSKETGQADNLVCPDIYVYLTGLGFLGRGV